MKKLFLLLVGAAFGYGVNAQSIVSTTPQNRAAVIEEYTGVNCGCCPDGHAIANAYKTSHPETVIINIHQGGYAVLYTTPWGDALAGQTNLGGYPTGSVNRTTNGCKVAALDRGNFASAANGIIPQQSPVNLGATASIDAARGLMTIHVEAYYTADVSQNYNLLNIALLQDSIKGPQSNYGNYNSAYITADGQYLHMHMLRDLITGQWGDTIGLNTNGTIPAGTFVSKDYTYTIPAGTFHDAQVVLKHLHLAVFVTDGYKEDCSNLVGPNIWTGINVDPQIVPATTVAARVADIKCDPYNCEDYANVSADILNSGLGEITSLSLTCTDLSTLSTQSYDWTGSLAEGATATIAFPNPITVNIGQTDSILVEVKSINGIAQEGFVNETTVKKAAPAEGHGQPYVVIRTDKYGSEMSWKIYDMEDNVLASGSGYTNGGIRRDTVIVSAITEPGCFVFEVLDSYGDGGGMYKVIGADDEIIVSNTTGSWGSGERKVFKILDVVGLNDANENIYQAMIYPNPAIDVATLRVDLLNASNAQINVLDVMGREVIDLGNQNLVSGENLININTSSLNSGIYYVRVTTNNGITTNKLSIVK